jgi:type III secretion protein U
MAEKTEQATPKKLADARKKGQVAKSQDIPSAVTFIVSIVVIVALFEFILGNLGAFITSCFKAAATNRDTTEEIPNKLMEAWFVILKISVPIVFASTLAGVAANFFVVGPLLTFEVFKLDINKFNPVENLKQKFKIRTLVELLKSVVKITVAAYIIYTIIYKHIPTVSTTVTLPLLTTAIIVKDFFVEMVIKVGIFFIVVAIVDWIYQKMSFSKQMMMEKHEVKQEYKNSEGDPEIKGKRKQLAREIAFSDGPGNTRKAKAVVTNPTHIAVAITYEPEEGIIAPMILAMGEGMMAKQIVKEAEKHNIPIMQHIYLARRLYAEGDINDYVPEDTYEIIAEVLKWVASLKDGDEIV